MLKDFTQEKYDVIIQAGQSNSDGSGYGIVEKPFQQNELIWYLNRNFTISLAAERAIGNSIFSDFSLSFATRYINDGYLTEPRKLLIVRSAVGGTGFGDKRWGLSDDLYLHMMKMVKTALELNPDNRLVVFLWHQGETDANLNATFDTHYNNLSTLVKSVRDTFNCKDLPFIAGDFVPQWKKANITKCEPVVNAIRAVCSDIGNAAFVETEELTSNSQDNGGDDTIHFSRKALMALGEKYFEEYIKLHF